MSRVQNMLFPVQYSPQRNTVVNWANSQRTDVNRNLDSVPIVKLPPEMLAEIFIHYRDDSVTNSDRPYEWIKVAHICHHFREVALACPRLWSAIPVLGNDAWVGRTREMLTRSKQTLLTLKYRNDPENKDLMKLITSQMHRMQTLSISILSDRPLKAASAPNLRSLHLYVTKQTNELRWTRMFGPGGTPNLEEMLVVSHAGLSWTERGAFPRTLRMLSITQWNRTPRSLPDVLGVLEGLPHLESLTLDGLLPVFPPQNDSLPIVEHPIIFPRLAQLTIAGSASRCAVFLSNIIVPELIGLGIKCVVTSQVALSLLAPMVSARLSDSSSSTSSQRFLSFILDESSGPSETRLIAWSSLEHANGLPAADTNRPRSLTMFITHDHWEETLPRFIAQLPIADVQLLYACVGAHSRSQFACEKLEVWRTAFQPIFALREVHVVGRRLPLPWHRAASENNRFTWNEPDGRFLSLFSSDSSDGEEAEREARRLERFLRRPRYYRERPAEQETVWRRLREIFSTVEVCTMNDCISTWTRAEFRDEYPKLGCPLIPPWKPLSYQVVSSL